MIDNKVRNIYPDETYLDEEKDIDEKALSEIMEHISFLRDMFHNYGYELFAPGYPGQSRRPLCEGQNAPVKRRILKRGRNIRGR